MLQMKKFQAPSFLPKYLLSKNSLDPPSPKYDSMIIYYCMGGLPSKFAPKCAQIRSALTPVLEAASTGFFAQLACELCRQCVERSPS